MTTLSPGARAVIDAARGGDDPTAADRARVRTAVFAAVGAAAAAAKAGTAYAAGGGGSGNVSNATSENAALPSPFAAGSGSTLGLKIVGGLVVVAVLVVGGYLLLRGDDGGGSADDHAVAMAAPHPALVATPVTKEPPTLAAARSLPAVVESMASGDDELVELEPTIIDRSAAPARARTSARVAVPEQPRAVPDESRSFDNAPTELALLGKAKRAENTSDWATALELADTLRQLYPKGKLLLERVALEARVLCKSGKLAAGQKKAARFLEQWPRAPQASSLRLHCQLAD